MRPDMNRVVIERPRHGGKGSRLRRPRRLDEEMEVLPKLEGMKLAYTDRKKLSDLLGPLWRYLDKQIGRRWDDVWSEIANTLDFRSVAGLHIKSHIVQHVELHAQFIDGVPYHLPIYGQFSKVDGLWVDPRDGILKNIPKTPYRYKKPEPVGLKILDEWTQLHCLRGSWFLVKLAPIPADRAIVIDALGPAYTTEKVSRWNGDLKKSVVLNRPADTTRTLEERYGRPGVYAVSKRQISRKEKKEYGLIVTGETPRRTSQRRPSPRRPRLVRGSAGA
jgi:hypothetical protein